MTSTPRSQSIQLHDTSNHEYKRPPPGTASRSPCPALNALANHGYIRRSGTNLTFFEVLRAVSFVYNFSYPLAFLLTAGGFLTCGKITWGPTGTSRSRSPPSRSPSYMNLSIGADTNFNSNSHSNSDSKPQPLSFPYNLIALLVSFANIMTYIIPHLTLDLQSLSARGARKIAHDASYVHPNDIPSTAPDSRLLKALLLYAARPRDEDGDADGHEGHINGMSFEDIALYHAERVRLSAALDGLHKTISLGECALTWQALRGHSAQSKVTSYSDESKEDSSLLERTEESFKLDGLIPAARLQQWFGDERLPDGWWDVTGVRPSQAIGVLHTRGMANHMERIGERKLT